MPLRTLRWRPVLCGRHRFQLGSEAHWVITGLGGVVTTSVCFVPIGNFFAFVNRLSCVGAAESCSHFGMVLDVLDRVAVDLHVGAELLVTVPTIDAS